MFIRISAAIVSEKFSVRIKAIRVSHRDQVTIDTPPISKTIGTNKSLRVAVYDAISQNFDSRIQGMSLSNENSLILSNEIHLPLEMRSPRLEFLQKHHEHDKSFYISRSFLYF